MGYFKPPRDAHLSDLRNKDRGSAKEFEYVIAANFYTNLGLMEIKVARSGGSSAEDMGRMLQLVEIAMKAVVEVLSRSALYFRDITEQ